MVRITRPAAFILALLLVAAVVTGGCGKNQGEGDAGSGVFDVTRIPGIGSVYEYLVNDLLPAESQGIPVGFEQEAAWDFTSGPDEATARVTVMPTEGMPGSDMFPGANLCLKSEVYGETAYVYYLQDSVARRQMGLYIASGEGSGFWEKYDPPKTILRFPVELPKTEPQPEEITHVTSMGFSEVIVCLSAVRWIDTVKVPAGEFPQCAMVQLFDVHYSDSGTYSELSYAWYAPDVGQVAYIRSLPNEAQPVFSMAADFRRLASYQAVP